MTTAITAAAAVGTSVLPAQTGPTAGAAGSDYTMFLRLLTTQMKNQDPLNPMDSTQYTQQLAQYSQVEQAVEQNSSLKAILSQMTSQGLIGSANLIGHNGVFDTADAGLTADAPASWSYSASRPLASLTATITDASGKQVGTSSLPVNGLTGAFDWTGEDGGARAAAGTYHLVLSGQDAAGGVVPVAVHSTGTITGAISNGGATTLEVNGAALPVSSLLSVRTAGG